MCCHLTARPLGALAAGLHRSFPTARRPWAATGRCSSPEVFADEAAGPHALADHEWPGEQVKVLKQDLFQVGVDSADLRRDVPFKVGHKPLGLPAPSPPSATSLA